MSQHGCGEGALLRDRICGARQEGGTNPSLTTVGSDRTQGAASLSRETEIQLLQALDTVSSASPSLAQP